MKYCIFDLNDIVKIKEWGKFFSNSPKDPYVQEGFRYKSISWHCGEDKNFKLLPHYPLFQEKKYNQIHGNIVRDYSPIDNELHQREDFYNLLYKFSTICRLKSEEVILVQLQRIDCHSNQQGLTALEGFHRDGIDWLGIFVVSRTNITGAKTQVKDSLGQIIFDKIIPEGNLLILSDTEVLHYSTPIVPSINANYGYRDVVLITACSKNLIGHNPASTNIRRENEIIC
ncbi:Uncharacterized protein conserved in bacteria [Legionella busanensis]|uniref:Uncharacterized protein conserved in bacteria n=1 Tax=Legionella busanensis TaxID=190655 RepID=A0A378JI86_9GAMM|nr:MULTISPECIES: 2OG-Fe dioxygenase family protein [Legionella]STX50481.1 Uncharacterized protein conserved in bacteria [Legionella busanensis]